MCGICGIVNYQRGELVDRQAVLQMCKSIVHRGPDEEGIYLGSHVGMGMRRLSIIDLSSGSQPIFNEDRSLAIVFNGEIYNYQELKEQLEQAGHRFSTRSDTEVIIHAYEQWGLDCPRHLRGMFLFSIYDTHKDELFIARDRLGKKPLYYYRDSRRLIYASEIKALLTFPDVPRHLNLGVLDAYLTLGYVPAPQTMFAEINKLPSGSWLLLKDGEVKVQEYWDISYETTANVPFDEAKHEIRRLLEEAIRIRLMSEVPLGAFLSGGIDSSVIVGVMSRLMSQPVDTFSVGFEGEDLNELPFARIAAKAFGTNHHELMLTDCTPDLLERLVWHMDEPVADPAAVPTMLISQLARRHVTVVLTGEGGDELFAGYSYYQRSRWADRYQLAPEGLRRTLLPLAAEAVNRLTGREIYHNRTQWYWSMPAETQMGAWVALFTGPDRRELVDPTGRLKASNWNHGGLEAFARYYRRAGKVSKLHRQMYIDSRVWLPDDLLMKVDKMSMAHSIEARAPYLDHQLFEYVCSLPDEYKLKDGVSKYIFKEVAREILPAEIVNRPKHTFDVPIDHWLKGSLCDTSRELLANGMVAGERLFNPQVTGGLLWQDLQAGKPGTARQLWTLVNLSLWAQLYNVTVA